MNASRNVSDYSLTIQKDGYEQTAPKWQAFDEESEKFLSFGEDPATPNAFI